MTRSERVYAWLLRAYPRRWRARFERGMLGAFAADLNRVRSRGIVARALFWIATVVQTLWFGIAERLSGVTSVRSFLAVDARAAVRALRAAPVITTMAILSLALGIGANTALFSILNSLLLKPLPVRDPGSLVLLEGELTNPIWEELRARQTMFLDAMAVWSTDPYDLSAGGRTDFVNAALVSGNLFDVLGLRTTLGRPLTEADDDRRGGPDGPVAVITTAFWKARYGSASGIVGRSITINRVPFTIVGVVESGFRALDIGTDVSLLMPVATAALLRGNAGRLDGRSNWWLHGIGRLKPGQTIDEATAAIRAVQPPVRTATIPAHWDAAMQREYLTDPFRLSTAVNGRSPLRGQYREPLTTILVVVAAVLLIACANIASLLLSRAEARRRELSVRLALGATRARLARQLMVESLLLSAAGAVLGLLIASWGGALLVRQLSSWADVVSLDLAIDWRVLGFTAGAAILTALIFGTAPAMSVSRVEPGETLKTSARQIAGGRRFGVRQALIVVQVALSLALVVAAGLFVRTFVSLTRVPLGFDPRPLTVVDVELAQDVSDPAVRIERFEQLRAAAAAVPGVTHAAASAMTPISDSGWNAPVEVPGGLALPERRRLDWINAISPEWFETYGMRMREGRAFTSQDRRGTPLVMIVNEAFVKRRLGDGVAAVGRYVTGGLEHPSRNGTYQIVGVVSDTVYRQQRRGAEATMYLPLAQLAIPESEVSLTVRTAAGPGEVMTRQLAEALARVDRTGSLTFRAFREQIDATMTRERLMAMLSGFFGVLALVMVSIGLYGVTAYWVSRRRGEIGIRIALGAHPRGVVRLVLRQISWLIVIGIAAGAILSLWAARFAGTLLFGLEPRDPATYIGAALVLLVIGFAAGWLPARRAAQLDPVKVLREN